MSEEEQPEERQLTWGRKLAHNDKKVRDKTVKVLRLWLSKQADLSVLDMLKIWKGLFYCFWMSDKRPVQRELAETLTGLIGAAHPQCQMRFVEAFFSTLVREWTGIDRLRLDKYYMLVETFVGGSFRALVESGWDEDALDEFGALMTAGPLAPDGRAARGLATFIVDKWFIELKKAATQVPSESLNKLLEPFYRIMALSPDKRLVKLTQAKIFEPLLPENTSEDETLVADVNTIVLRLFELASSRDTIANNRNPLYQLHGQFETSIKQLMAMAQFTEGVNSSDEEEEPVDEEDEEEPEPVPVVKKTKVKTTKKRAARDDSKKEGSSKTKESAKKKKKKSKA